MTFLEALVAALARAAEYNQEDCERPAAVLWPDAAREWEPLLPALRKSLPQLLTLGEFDSASCSGPAIWVRAMLAKALPEATWSADVVPVIYLPGFSRQQLRAVEDCPHPLQPVAELQYRGFIWSQVNTRDWTVLAYLVNKQHGLGANVAQDAATIEALRHALVKLAGVNVEHLQSKPLSADDFNALITPDPARDLLDWMNDPKAAHARWNPSTWATFRKVCKSKFKLDPEKDGELVAAEQLGRREGAWLEVWKRFEEAPRHYPNLPALLRRAKPDDGTLHFRDPSPTWPQDNEAEESKLRSALVAMSSAAPAAAATKMLELDVLHEGRRRAVWAELGESPLAVAAQHLAALVLAVRLGWGSGSTAEGIAEHYAEHAWRADDAAISALASVHQAPDIEAIKVALRAVYLPHIEAGALALQRVYDAARASLKKGAATPDAGGCILFVDGLRFDVARRLAAVLTTRAAQVDLSRSWSATPSVTATSKPTTSPIADQLTGDEQGVDFQPCIRVTGKELTSDRFRALLAEAGLQVLRGEETGDPTGRAWAEYADLDSAGHSQQWKLAHRIKEEVDGLAQRVCGLLEAGWRHVRIVTDHGWLLVPGGLPKTDLPKFLTESKWGRCAVLQAGATVKVPTVPWYWNASVTVAVAPGVSCFVAGMEYAHGGVSPQECVTPVLVVRSGAATTDQVQVSTITWRGLRCNVVVEGAPAGCSVDLRSKAADAKSHLRAAGSDAAPVTTSGSATIYANDEHQGTVAVLVVVGPDGRVIAKRSTTVGGED